jgi:hypothetical protein
LLIYLAIAAISWMHPMYFSQIDLCGPPLPSHWLPFQIVPFGYSCHLVYLFVCSFLSLNSMHERNLDNFLSETNLIYIAW